MITIGVIIVPYYTEIFTRLYNKYPCNQRCLFPNIEAVQPIAPLSVPAGHLGPIKDIHL